MNLVRPKFLALSRSHLRDTLIVLALLLSRPSAPLFQAGLVAFAVGLALRLWAKGTLQRNRRFTFRGPYALCRHPFYLGNLILDLGICLMSGQVLLVVLYPAYFLWVYREAIHREEEFLRNTFAKESVRLGAASALFPLFPRRWRYLKAAVRLRRILDQREVSRTLRLFAVPLLIVIADQVWEDGIVGLTESECLAPLLGVCVLHLAANIVYHLVEKPRKTAYLSPGESILGLGLLSAATLVFLAVVPYAGSQDLVRLAHRLDAIPVASPSKLDAVASSGRSGLYLVDDDTLEQVAPEIAKRFLPVRTCWSRFEVYRLLRTADDENLPRRESVGARDR